ncbi:MAG: hypothetical protein MUO26_03940 [Methanotrichaceae archaeon]|nr:hypothetical protein [Methanotrichaceae archaeon]
MNRPELERRVPSVNDDLVLSVALASWWAELEASKVTLLVPKKQLVHPNPTKMSDITGEFQSSKSLTGGDHTNLPYIY